MVELFLLLVPLVLSVCVGDLDVLRFDHSLTLIKFFD